MKRLLLISCLFFPLAGYCQKLTEYKAKNGKNYHVGDTVIVGLGNQPNGDFKYIQMSGIGASLLIAGDNKDAKKGLSGSYAIIKKINSVKRGGGPDKIILNTKIAGLTTFDISIEEAIAVCEVTPCQIGK